MRYSRKNYCVQFRGHLDILCQEYASILSKQGYYISLCLLDSYITHIWYSKNERSQKNHTSEYFTQSYLPAV